MDINTFIKTAAPGFVRVNADKTRAFGVFPVSAAESLRADAIRWGLRFHTWHDGIAELFGTTTETPNEVWDAQVKAEEDHEIVVYLIVRSINSDLSFRFAGVLPAKDSDEKLGGVVCIKRNAWIGYTHEGYDLPSIIHMLASFAEKIEQELRGGWFEPRNWRRGEAVPRNVLFRRVEDAFEYGLVDNPTVRVVPDVGAVNTVSETEDAVAQLWAGGGSSAYAA